MFDRSEADGMPVGDRFDRGGSISEPVAKDLCRCGLGAGRSGRFGGVLDPSAGCVYCASTFVVDLH